MIIPTATFGLDGWPERIALIGVVIAITVVAFMIIAVLTRRLTRHASATSNVEQWQQRRTAVTLLATTLRYIVLIGAVFSIITIAVGGGSVGALGGSAVIAVALGFASQRLLADMVAGFFILFEGQYSVGDTIMVEPSDIAGVVEEVGIRTTLIAQSDGTHSYVPNGAIDAVTRYEGAQTRMSVTVVTRDPEATEDAVRNMARIVGPSHGLIGGVDQIERHAIGDGISLVQAHVRVASTHIEAARGLLAATLAALPAGTLCGEPVIAPFLADDPRPIRSTTSSDH